MNPTGARLLAFAA